MQHGKSFYHIGIGASAGGQAALCEFFDHLPTTSGPAYFIVTHLHPDFSTNLSDIIQQHTQIPVIKTTGSILIRPDTVYVLAENKKMFIEGQWLRTIQRPASERINRAIDFFFVSLANVVKNNAIGVILSGSGSDGTNGALAIKASNGRVFVQNPETAEFTGMPHSIICADHPSILTTPSDLARAIANLTVRSPSLP